MQYVRFTGNFAVGLVDFLGTIRQNSILIKLDATCIKTRPQQLKPLGNGLVQMESKKVAPCRQPITKKIEELAQISHLEIPLLSYDAAV